MFLEEGAAGQLDKHLGPEFKNVSQYDTYAKIIMFFLSKFDPKPGGRTALKYESDVHVLTGEHK